MEKELTNNMIKIMNMKADFNRMRKLMAKIHQTPSKPKMRSSHSDANMQQSPSLAQL